MFPLAALVFLVIPVIEIYFLIQVGEQIGALWTVLLVVLTAVIGVKLLRQQGLSTLMKAQKKMQSGTLPANEIVEGIALLISGAFLLTPGFFTDFLGFLLLIPTTRKVMMVLFAAKATHYFKNKMYSNVNQPRPNPFDQSNPSFQQPPASKGDVIEGVKYHKEEN